MARGAIVRFGPLHRLPAVRSLTATRPLRPRADRFGYAIVGRPADKALAWAVSLGPRALTGWYDAPGGRKKVRYAVVSVVALPLGTAAVGAFNLAGFTAAWAAVLGSCFGAIPSYVLNRYWVWGKTDQNSVVREILPFWAITLVGLALAFLIGHEAGEITRHHHITGVRRLLILLTANTAGFGLLWVAKYVLCNTVLFGAPHRQTTAVDRGANPVSSLSAEGALLEELG